MISQMRCYTDGIFGPVVSVVRAGSYAEACSQFMSEPYPRPGDPSDALAIAACSPTQDPVQASAHCCRLVAEWTPPPLVWRARVET
jgi:hypothetical protein